MRWSHFVVLQLLLIAIVAGIVYLHKDRVILSRSPPPSLAQWYKPQSERQLWLHNMFKLRREMQAVRFYADQNDPQRLNKWAARLAEHYLKIAEMVPEWEDKLNRQALSDLKQGAEADRPEEVTRALDALGESCKSCHADYRIVAAATYRAPDFGPLEIEPSVSFADHMGRLAEQVNRIKIASEDGAQGAALSSLSDLEKGMEALGQACTRCHEKDPRVYPSTAMAEAIADLRTSLKAGTPKDQGRDLGTLAVLACARCHGTHRLAYEAGKILRERPNWRDLIEH
ncbi:MAG: cytochrome c [Gammaproteobacteria bacterium]|nr:cytochrome c [Gammaproteobacteria bacterium]NIR98953.1 cytochrome c [Gammaproteobacteria bacterium]NIT62234.1 cytochrome c [Gammaproteobacteria bacterium]NIV19063.1 cytochrome c [Gammaproteobacteria bacterium]NIY30814.1 cytochrome c [Gammaproteobacteria bacterium]